MLSSVILGHASVIGMWGWLRAATGDAPMSARVAGTVEAVEAHTVRAEISAHQRRIGPPRAGAYSDRAIYPRRRRTTCSAAEIVKSATWTTRTDAVRAS